MTDDPKTMSDRDRIAAYQSTTGEPGDPLVDAIVEEMEVRNLDF